MPTSHIYVSGTDGEPVRYAYVQLRFDSGHESTIHYTNTMGQVTINHLAEGEARIMVYGSQRCYMTMPNNVAITL